MEQPNELKAAILIALAEDSARSDRDIAAALTVSQAELIAALTPAWVMDRLLMLVRLYRRNLPNPDPAQMVFPFRDLSVHIPLKKDETAELRYATIGILRDSEKVLLRKQRQAKPRSNSMLGRIQREIELVEPYAFINRRITVERVHELIAGGTPPPPKPKRSPMSDAMKRYWDAKTAEERSAIARRRNQKRYQGKRR